MVLRRCRSTGDGVPEGTSHPGSKARFSGLRRNFRRHLGSTGAGLAQRGLLHNGNAEDRGCPKCQRPHGPRSQSIRQLPCLSRCVAADDVVMIEEELQEYEDLKQLRAAKAEEASQPGLSLQDAKLGFRTACLPLALKVKLRRGPLRIAPSGLRATPSGKDRGINKWKTVPSSRSSEREFHAKARRRKGDEERRGRGGTADCGKRGRIGENNHKAISIFRHAASPFPSLRLGAFA